MAARGGDLAKVAAIVPGVKAVPNWLDRRLNYAYKQKHKAAARKDRRLAEWAEKEISRLRELGGL